MKLVTKIFTGTALTLAIGMGLILGNAYLTSIAITKQNKESEPVVLSDTLPMSTSDMNVVALRAQTGDTILAPGRMDAVPLHTQEEIDILIEEKLKHYRDNGFSEKKIKEIRKKMKNRDKNPTYVEGIPGEGDITVKKAIDTAVNTIKKKYALNDSTIVRFETHTGFNIVNPDKPQWNISLNPKNNAEFSDIGCYNVILDAKTGRVIEVTSAVDAKG